MSIRLTSDAFAANEPIPAKYTRDGENVSPALSWEHLPPATKQLALICDDPDAPRAEPWVHWVAYGIPGDSHGLLEGIPQEPALKSPVHITQGVNTYKTTGYDGPSPPPGHGPHRYHFKLYALNKSLRLEPGLNKRTLLAALVGHIIETMQLIGTYERK